MTKLIALHGVDLEKLPHTMQEFFTINNDFNQYRQLWRFDIYKIKKEVYKEREPGA